MGWLNSYSGGVTGEVTAILLRWTNGSTQSELWTIDKEVRLERLTCDTAIALIHLGLLDLVLDMLFLEAPLLGIPPPNRTLVIASHAEVIASTARGVLLVALLSAQATCKAT